MVRDRGRRCIERIGHARCGLAWHPVCGAQPLRAPGDPARPDPVPLNGQAAAAARPEAAQGGRLLASRLPVPLSGLRLLTVSHRGFDGRTHTGQLIVNKRAARPLARVFRKLYGLHFPIRHMDLADFYGPRRDRPDDVTASFECRQAVPSPCSGGSGTGTWSQHAYGLAVDVNPGENPYVGCGQSRDRKARRYRDRSRHREGMVTPRAVAAFRSVAGAGAAPGPATPRTTCTSPPPGARRRSCASWRSTTSTATSTRSTPCSPIRAPRTSTGGGRAGNGEREVAEAVGAAEPAPERPGRPDGGDHRRLARRRTGARVRRATAHRGARRRALLPRQPAPRRRDPHPALGPGALG